jgi:hypothetical protein
VDRNGVAAQLARGDVMGVKSCCISNVVDGSDGDMLWDVSSECVEDEGTDCDDGDSDTDW